MMSWNQLSFQDASSPSMSMLISFHDSILLVMILVMSMVSYMILSVMLNKEKNQMIKEAHNIEMIWTITPALILMALAIPSLRLLYLMDESSNPSITVKAIGHQWYWSYEYSDFPNISFDSFMNTNLEMGEYRLLEVDNRLVLPISLETRLLISAADVIHAWTIPSMGLKVDAIPGRLNQVSMIPNRIGIFYGQCSEICGANHSFMPISLEIISEENFIKWTKSF